MRVFAISDFHLDSTHSKPMNVFGDVWEGHTDEILKSIKENNLTSDDILIVAGDLSWAMKLEDAKEDLKFFEQIKSKIIVVRGNHEYWWQSISAVRNALPQNMHAIQNDAIKIGNIVFCGTRGWNLPENDFYAKDDQKIYDREVIRLKLSIDEAKKLYKEGDEMICVMHFPPFNSKGEGNLYLDAIYDSPIKNVIFGHLHGNKHNCKLIQEKNGVKFYLTSCDALKNKLVQIY